MQGKGLISRIGQNRYVGSEEFKDLKNMGWEKIETVKAPNGKSHRQSPISQRYLIFLDILLLIFAIKNCTVYAWYYLQKCKCLDFYFYEVMFPDCFRMMFEVQSL